MDRLHKRFTGFLVCCGLLMFGLILGPVDSFGTFASVLVGLYTVYLGGQSATDFRNSMNKPV